MTTAVLNRLSVAILAVSFVSQSGLAPRKVWEQSGASYYATYQAISEDGRYLAFTDWNSGNLVIRDMAESRDQLLTSDGRSTEAYAEEKAISPDGTKIAYGWENDRGDAYELRVIDRRGGKARVVGCCFPWGWSADGQSILALTARTQGEQDLVWIPEDGGSLRVIKHFEKGQRPNHIRLSPNGRFAAYDVSLLSDRPGVAAQRDVCILSLETKQETAIQSNPAVDLSPAWLPDSSAIVFSSNRGGTWGLWIARIAQGGGEIGLARAPIDVGSVDGMWFSNSGDFYVSRDARPEPAVLLAAVDSSQAAANRLTRLSSELAEAQEQAAWSPTGDQVVYVRPPANALPDASPRSALAIRTMSTNSVRVLDLPMQRIQNPVWEHDGRSVVVQGADLNTQQGLFRISLESGAIVPIAAAKRDSRQGRDRPAVSTDGKRVFFLAQTPKIVGFGILSPVSKQMSPRLASRTSRISLFRRMAGRSRLPAAVRRDRTWRSRSYLRMVVPFDRWPGSRQDGPLTFQLTGARTVAPWLWLLERRTVLRSGRSRWTAVCRTRA